MCNEDIDKDTIVTTANDVYCCCGIGNERNDWFYTVSPSQRTCITLYIHAHTIVVFSLGTVGAI